MVPIKKSAGRPARRETGAIGESVVLDRDVLRRAWRLVNVVGRPSRVRTAHVLTTALLSCRGDRAVLSSYGHGVVAQVEIPTLAPSDLQCLLVREDLPPEVVDRSLSVADLDPIRRSGFGAILYSTRDPVLYLARVDRSSQGMTPALRVQTGRAVVDLDWIDPDPRRGSLLALPVGSWVVSSGRALTALDSVRRCARRSFDRGAFWNYQLVFIESIPADDPSRASLQFVATDGNLVGSCALDARVAGGLGPVSTRVPVAGIRSLCLALLTLDRTDSVELIPGGGFLALRSGGAVVSAVCGEGAFPDWRSLCPAGPGRRVRLDSSQARRFAWAVEVALAFTPAGGPLEIHVCGEDSLALTSADGAARADVKVLTPESPCGPAGPQVVLRVRARDLYRCLSWAGAGELELTFWGPDRSVLLRREGGPEYLLPADTGAGETNRGG